MSNSTSPPWLDKGDNAWQLTAGTLVALQTVPGLCMLYAGTVKRKWAINSTFMALYAFAATLVCWVVWGYEVGFGEYMLPLAGRPRPVLGIGTLLGQSALPSAGVVQAFPLATMVYFQFVFAAVALVLVAGALLARMGFRAWMVFVPLWLSFSYCVGAYSIWGGGFLYQLGVIDYSGGYVIHLSSGTAGFVGAWWVGPRLKQDRAHFPPNNVLLTVVGAGILWTGWNGFNGGDPYAASPDAGVAVLNTNVAAATSLLTWTLFDLLFHGTPSILGAINGMIAGLVAITPAAGVVAGWGAIAIGVCSGSIPWLSMNIAGRRWSLFTRHVDDVLGVTHTHLVAGFLGGFLTGIFATKEGCEAFAIANGGGAVEGNGRQVWLQIVGGLFVIGWNLVWTSLIMCFIKYVCRIPLRMTEEELLIGDEAIHGEAAYCFGDDTMEGAVPSEATERNAAERLGRIRRARESHKELTVIEGVDVEAYGGLDAVGQMRDSVMREQEIKME